MTHVPPRRMTPGRTFLRNTLSLAMNRPNWWRVATFTFCLLAATGCGGNGLFQGSGRLTYKGRPVPSTYVVFQPEDLGKRASRGLTDDDGNFKLTNSRTDTGVLPGKHIVYVQYYISVDEELGKI